MKLRSQSHRALARASAVCAFLALLSGALPAALPVSGDRPAAAELVADLRERRPPEATEYRGRIRVRDGEGRRREVSLLWQVQLFEDRWESRYRTVEPTSGSGTELVVIHWPGRTNDYQIRSIDGSGRAGVAQSVAGEGTMVPFAGTDFWIADLGMEFLHWEDQQILDVRNRMRKGRSCKVLESRAPEGTTHGYQRVVAWIDRDGGGPVYAEAFDAEGKRVKVFEVDRITKHRGAWVVREMEIRNEDSDSRSSIRFEFDADTEAVAP